MEHNVVVIPKPEIDLVEREGVLLPPTFNSQTIGFKEGNIWSNNQFRLE